MTWGWAVRGDNLGTPAESAVKAAWPDYNADYLRHKLRRAERRFDPGLLDDVERNVFLQESVKGYEAEAEACLKAEFTEWLQGTHPANEEADRGEGYYVNEDDGNLNPGEMGHPKRRHVYEGEVSAQMADDQNGTTGWQATRWGTKQLTHLEGVRDFLRAGKIQEDNAERDMNLLAERGPQDLNEAWMYFKHWVKKRPVTQCDHDKYGSKKRLDDLEVDRMNGTGPSNWNSRTMPPQPWQVPNQYNSPAPAYSAAPPPAPPPGPTSGTKHERPSDWTGPPPQQQRPATAGDDWDSFMFDKNWDSFPNHNITGTTRFGEHQLGFDPNPTAPNKKADRGWKELPLTRDPENQKKERQISTPIFAGDVERQWYQQALATDQALKRAKGKGDPRNKVWYSDPYP